MEDMASALYGVKAGQRRGFFLQTVSVIGMLDGLCQEGPFYPFGCLLFFVVGQKQTIHFAWETDKFKRWDAIGFVLELANHLGILLVVERMAFGVIGRVVAIQIFAMSLCRSSLKI